MAALSPEVERVVGAARAWARMKAGECFREANLEIKNAVEALEESERGVVAYAPRGDTVLGPDGEVFADACGPGSMVRERRARLIAAALNAYRG